MAPTLGPNPGRGWPYRAPGPLTPGGAGRTPRRDGQPGAALILIVATAHWRKTMPARRHLLMFLVKLMAFSILALGACATPVAISPTATPTEIATATALPLTTAATAQST